MGALIGFVVGYVLGARAGQEGLDELKESWKSILESEEFRGFVALGKSLAQSKFEQASGAFAENLREFGNGKGAFGEALRGLDGNTNVLDVIGEIASSEQVRQLLASGGQILGSVLAQAMAVAEGRRANGSARAM